MRGAFEFVDGGTLAEARQTREIIKRVLEANGLSVGASECIAYVPSI